jgi:hypothetical protein
MKNMTTRMSLAVDRRIRRGTSMCANRLPEEDSHLDEGQDGEDHPDPDVTHDGGVAVSVAMIRVRG